MDNIRKSIERTVKNNENIIRIEKYREKIDFGRNKLYFQYEYYLKNGLIDSNITENKFIKMYINDKIRRIPRKKIDNTLLKSEEWYNTIINDYVSLEIQREIQKKSKYISTFIIKYKNNEIKIKIIESKKENLEEYITNITQIIKIMIDLYNGTGNLELVIFMIDKKKEIKSGVIGPNDINSGLTYWLGGYEGNNTKIILFRKEELYKVLFHELIHYYKLDFKNVEKEFFEDIFGVRGDKIRGNLYESYTELLATILNIIWISIRENKDEEELWEEENKYMKGQVAKVIKKNGYKDMLDFEMYPERYEEHSNVLSYTLIKSILLNNKNDIEEYIKKNTKNGKFILEYLEDYKQMIDENYTEKYKKDISYEMKHINSYEMRLTKNELTNNSKENSK